MTATARQAFPGLPATSDRTLMRRVQADDPEAFAELYDRHSARAYRVARTLCRRSGAAEEAVQEAFVSMWRSRASYQPGRGDVGAWALTIVRHRAIDVARRGGDHEQRRSDAAQLEDHAGPWDVDAGVIADEESQRLRILLSALPEAQREVIVLAFYGELTHTEIAAHLGLPAGTVKGRMRLGLEKLSSALA